MGKDVLSLAVQHHEAGRLKAAERLYKSVLKANPKNAVALNLLGVLAFQSGQHNKAIRLIGKAISVNPNYAFAHFNLGNVFKYRGKLADAEAAFGRVVTLNPRDAGAYGNLGIVLQEQGRFADAAGAFRKAAQLEPANPVAHYNLANAMLLLGEERSAAQAFQTAIQLRPDYAEAHTNLGNLFLGQNEYEKAAACFRRALEIRPDFAEAHANLGHALKELGQVEQALHTLETAVRLNPELPEAHNNLGAALRGLRRFKEAAAAFRRAAELRPDFVEALTNLGNTLFDQGDSDGAARAFDDALEVDPDDLDTIRTLAGQWERANRLDRARAAIERGLRLSPMDPDLNLIAAKCERREGKVLEAIDRLERIDRSTARSRTTINIMYELGRLYDRLDECEKAFPYFAEANRLSREHPPHKRINKNDFLALIDSVQSQLTQDWLDSWSATPEQDAQQTPVFFVGFPRSGTTLVEQVLASHPGLQTLDERPAIDETLGLIPGFPEAYPHALAELTAEDIAHLRDRYFETAHRFVTPEPGQLLIDKMPLNIVHTILIWRLFPHAKIILAVRHPYDVCLSCFMQNFEITAAMANFFTFDDAAKLYVKVMTLWQKCALLLPLEHHVVKYEDFVGDLEAQTRSLLGFLGVEWDPSVLEYAEHAKQRPRIGTVSYDQVVEPVYQRSRFRWKHYQKQVGASLEPLKSFAEAFGYEER